MNDTPITLLIRAFVKIVTTRFYVQSFRSCPRRSPVRMKALHVCTLGKRSLQICLDGTLSKLILYWQRLFLTEPLKILNCHLDVYLSQKASNPPVGLTQIARAQNESTLGWGGRVVVDHSFYNNTVSLRFP